MPSDPSIVFRKKFLANQLAFNSKYRPLFDKVAKDIAALSNDPSARFVRAFTFGKQMDQKITTIMTSFHDKNLMQTQEEITKSWNLSNRKNDEILRDYLNTMSSVKNIAKLDYFSASLPALKAYIGRGSGTQTLSGAVWKITDQLRAEMEIHLGIGLMNGDSAAKISQRIRQYLNNPNTLFRRVKDERGKLVASKQMIANAPGQGVYNSAYKNAMRLARTETNMAYLLADHIRWLKMDMVKGVRIELSDQHPDYKFPEICELLEGDYPKEFIFVGWHPQCLCHAVPILGNEDYFRAYLRGEKTNYEPKQVTEYPPNFRQYIKQYGNKISNAESQPYWFANNKELIDQIAKAEGTALNQPIIAQAVKVPPLEAIVESNKLGIKNPEEFQYYSQQLDYYKNLFRERGNVSLLKEESAAFDLSPRGLSNPLSDLNHVLYRDEGLENLKRIYRWQGSANNPEAVAFKLLAEGIENTPKTIIKESDDFVMQKIKDFGMTRQQYLRIRAMNQAYMDAIEVPDMVELQRGTDGGSGKKIVDAIIKADPKTQFWNITDNSLAGYTTDNSTAASFGYDQNGITIRFSMPKEDIVVHKDLFSGISISYEGEKEFIVRGLDRGINMVDIRFRAEIEFEGRFQKLYRHMYKEYGETLEDFWEKVRIRQEEYNSWKKSHL